MYDVGLQIADWGLRLPDGVSWQGLWDRPIVNRKS